MINRHPHYGRHSEENDNNNIVASDQLVQEHPS
jgi:hypothetical protein